MSKIAVLQSTGVEFPEVTTFWDGDKMRSVGAGVRAKKFAFMPVKVCLCMWKSNAFSLRWGIGEDRLAGLKLLQRM